MDNTEVGSTIYHLATKIPKTMLDLIPLSFPLGSAYKSVLLASDAEFMEFIQQHITVTLEEGATMQWTPEERLEVIQLAMTNKEGFQLFRGEFNG